MILLSADIGGTNTSIALIEYDNGTFTLKERKVYATKDLENFSQALSDFFQTLADFAPHNPHNKKITAACLSIAGPIKDKHCVPTNIPWTLNGYEIERQFGIPTMVINDFTAVCYGIPLLDIHDLSKIHPLPLPNGRLPPQQDYLPGISVQAAVGAGTGLGLGYILTDKKRICAMPAEGGHADFAPHNALSRELNIYLGEKLGFPVHAEHLVSGQGIVNIFHFMRDVQGADSPEIQKISSLEDRDKPEAISEAAQRDKTCGSIIKLFIELYARAAHNVALSFIPKKGLFLAGGIAAKNKHLFLEEHHFMKNFIHNTNNSIQAVLRDVPVYIVEDYCTSLYGAAHAFIQLQNIRAV